MYRINPYEHVHTQDLHSQIAHQIIGTDSELGLLVQLSSEKSLSIGIRQAQEIDSLFEWIHRNRNVPIQNSDRIIARFGRSISPTISGRSLSIHFAYFLFPGLAGDLNTQRGFSSTCRLH